MAYAKKCERRVYLHQVLMDAIKRRRAELPFYQSSPDLLHMCLGRIPIRVSNHHDSYYAALTWNWNSNYRRRGVALPSHFGNCIHDSSRVYWSARTF